MTRTMSSSSAGNSPVIRDGALADDRGHAIDLGQPLEARGDVHLVADRRIVEALHRAEIADAAVAGVDADADADLLDADVRAAVGLVRAIARSAPPCPRPSRARSGRLASAWSGSSSGAFQNAMMASPIYLSMVPRLLEDRCRSSGVSSSLMKRVSSRGAQPLRDGGEVPHVAEHQRQLAHLAAELELVRDWRSARPRPSAPRSG